jgi:hypothetical protein
MFDVRFRIEGPIMPPGVAAFGERIEIRGGPFSRRPAYLVAEIVGQAAVDVILGPAG